MSRGTDGHTCGMGARTDSVSFYYAVFIWAVMLYGAGALFKIGTVFLYRALIPWFSDDPVQPVKKSDLTGSRRVLWWGLGIYLSLSAILQIPPTAALASRHQLATWPLTSRSNGIGRAAHAVWLHLWFSHPLTLNITVFMMEGLFGLFLLTERNTRIGRITLIAAAVFGIFAGFFIPGLGFLFSFRHSWLAGAPGAGFLLAALACALAFIPEPHWRPYIATWGRRVWLVLFALGALSELTLAPAYAAAPTIIPATWVLALPAALSHHTTLWLRLVWTAVTGALALAPWTKGWLQVLSIIALAVLWWWFQGLGLMAVFALAPNTMPLWFIALWAIWQTAGPSGRRHPQPAT